MILSDRTIREELDAGQIGIEPLGENAIQPSSVDIRLDNSFRVFLNHTRTVIDVKEDLSDLTQPIEIDDDDAFILHPGEFVLASTREVITLPDDIVARIEGKSSLARLGLLIHSSLPGSEPVYVLENGRLVARPIEEVVRKQLDASVVAFDPDTFTVGYYPITGWYEGPEDKIFEIELASGRRVNVTAGHNVFTVDRRGELNKIRTGALRPGTRIAVPRKIPTPPVASVETPEIRIVDLVPEPMPDKLTLAGPSVVSLIESDPEGVVEALCSAGFESTASYYCRIGRLPYAAARRFPQMLARLTCDDRFGWRGGTNSIPAMFEVDDELAWMLGMYVAEGYKRSQQVVISNTDQIRLDRLQAVCERLGLPTYRSAKAVTICSALLSSVLEWMGVGGKAPTKRIPPVVFSWPIKLTESFLWGMVDGDGSTDGGRTSIWTTSERLVSDIMVLLALHGQRVGSCLRAPRGNAMRSWQVYAPHNEHKLLTAIPLPDQLLVQLRHQTGWTQADAAQHASYGNATDLCNIEQRSGREAIRRTTAARLRGTYAGAGVDTALLDRLVDGDLVWDDVVAVRDTGRVETIYDIEVRPGGRRIENFLAGHGGVFVSNTAGFIDPGFSGHITLELANVATLPITLYPGMKIGQISFMRMTTPADVPYGSPALGSKYHGQRGPTPSRYFENFDRDPGD